VTLHLALPNQPNNNINLHQNKTKTQPKKTQQNCAELREDNVNETTTIWSDDIAEPCRTFAPNHPKETLTEAKLAHDASNLNTSQLVLHWLHICQTTTHQCHPKKPLTHQTTLSKFCRVLLMLICPYLVRFSNML